MPPIDDDPSFSSRCHRRRAAGALFRGYPSNDHARRHVSCHTNDREEVESSPMLDAMRDTISTNVLQALKCKPSSFDAQRWIPRLVDEIERLRECLKEREA